MFNKEHLTLRVLIYGAVMLAFYMLQSVDAFGLRFMGKAPELLLVLTVCTAFFESYTFSAFFGLAAGLLSDIVTGSITGADALIFMFAGFIISVLLQTMLRGFFLTYIFIELCTLGVYLLLSYAICAVFFGEIPFGSALIHTILPKFFLSALLMYPTYAIVRAVHQITLPER